MIIIDLLLQIVNGLNQDELHNFNLLTTKMYKNQKQISTFGYMLVLYMTRSPKQNK